MTSRREFLQATTFASALWLVPGTKGSGAQATAPAPDTRAGWLKMLLRVCAPVIENLAANQLRARMPVECPNGKPADRRKVTHLEALGRTLAGLAPWLALETGSGPEFDECRRWGALARQGLLHATDPRAPDFMNFTAGAQCLVDAAFLAHALLRAPRALWQKLDGPTQERLAQALRSTRTIKPGQNNWLLFSAMVETFLASAGLEWQAAPIETALSAHEQWYKGDGVYGDGPEFHWDYYNSYVIQPFLLDILEHLRPVTDRWEGLRAKALRRAQRYASIQERLIAPDGTFPVLGRSIAYRCGAFQLLAQVALHDQLPAELPPGQVRAALSAVIDRTLGAPGTFDEQGWLRIGLAGRQPALAEGYISTGSLYLCTVAFLPLGLPAEHPFWAERAKDWTARKAWAGQDLPADHALSR